MRKRASPPQRLGRPALVGVMDALTYEKASLCLAFALTWLFFWVSKKGDLLKAAKTEQKDDYPLPLAAQAKPSASQAHP